jgi:hypothetical protein
MHEPAVADRSEHEGQCEFSPQDFGPQIARSDGNRVTRSEGYVLKGAAIFPECDFSFAAAIQIIENWPGHTGFS